MTIILVIVGAILIIIGIATATGTDNCDGASFALCLAFAGIGTADISLALYKQGEKAGAYKILRNEYEISYMIDKDSVVTDTIIHIK